jgi:hypothetical protein
MAYTVKAFRSSLMRRLDHGFLFAFCALSVLSLTAAAQTFTSIPTFPLDTSGLVIQAHSEPLKPFTVAGERGVLLGQQDGTLEAWVIGVRAETLTSCCQHRYFSNSLPPDYDACVAQ